MGGLSGWYYFKGMPLSTYCMKYPIYYTSYNKQVNKMDVHCIAWIMHKIRALSCLLLWASVDFSHVRQYCFTYNRIIMRFPKVNKLVKKDKDICVKWINM